MKKVFTHSGAGAVPFLQKTFTPILVVAFFSAASCSEVFAQTNPAAQSIPYSQNFTALAASSTTYPAGWQGWQLSATGSSSAFRTIAPVSDMTLNGSSAAATTAGGVHNYNGKIGILSSGSADPSLCLAIVTTGVFTVQITFDIMTIRNPYDGSANTRINQADLQYRVGTAGSFTSVTGSANGIYQNNTTNQTGVVTTPQNSSTKSFTLPIACNNQAVVQIRWVQRDFTGAGSRPSFAVDNLIICTAVNTPTISIAGPSSFCSGGTSNYTSTITNGGTTPVYQWKKNGGNVGTNSSALTISGLVIADQISCTLTSNATCVSSTTANSNIITISTVNSSPTISSFVVANTSCPEATDGGIDITVTGGTAPYTICWDTMNTSNGPSYAVTFAAKTPGNHPYYGTGSAFGYLIDGDEGKELFLTRGISYSFNVITAGHPFLIASDVVGATLNFQVASGQSGAPATAGTVTFTPNSTHPSTLYYVCQFHQYMGYKANIVNGYCVEDLTGRGAGTYSVLVTDANGCTTTATYTISANASTLDASAGVTNASCGGVNNGAIDLTVTGGTGPYTICWDTTNTANGPDFSVMVNAQTPSNPYFGMGVGVTYYTDGVEAKELGLVRGVDYSFTIFSPGHPWHISTDLVGGSSANIVTSGQTGAPNDNGNVFFTPDNSHPSLLYYICANHQYMGYNVTISNGYCVEDLSGLGQGTYTATIMDANGCSINEQVTVGIQPSTLQVNGTVTNASCPGDYSGSIDLDITGGNGPYTVCWDTVNTAGSTFNVMTDVQTPSNPYFGMGPGVAFYINGEEAKELSLVKNLIYSFDVFSPGHPWHISTDYIGANTSGLVTDGQSGAPNDMGMVTFTPNNAHPSQLYYVCANHEYMGYNINILDAYCTEDLIGFAPGIYSYVVTDANGCSVSGEFTIDTGPDIVNPDITCPADIEQCDDYMAVYTESATDNCAGVTSSCDPESGSVFSAGVTQVTCTATDANSNVATCAFNVIINETPVIGSCPTDVSSCDPVVTYTSPPSSGFPSPDVDCVPASGSTFSTGTTVVTCTASNTCGSSTCTFNVTLNTPSTDPVSANSNAAYGQVCLGGNVTLSVSGGSLGDGADWVWYEGGCGSGSPVGTGASPVVTPSTAGPHSYCVRAEGTCNATSCQCVTIDVISAPPATTVNYSASISNGCIGAPAATFSVNNVSNCVFYRWTSGQSGILFNGNPGPYETPVPTVNVSFASLPSAGASGWSVCVFGGNACGTTNTVCTWVRATVSMPGPVAGSVIGCPGSSGNAYSVPSVSGAASYQWTATGGMVIQNNGSQSITVNFPGGFTTGVLSVRAQTSCGYIGPARSLTITANPLIPGIISGPGYPCPNANSVYSIPAVAGAVSYNWSTTVPGAIVNGTGTSCTILFPASTAGGSTVSVSASSSCPTTGPVRSKGIASGLPNTPGTISGPASGQCGQTGVSYSIAPVPNAASYNWSVPAFGTIVGPSNLSAVTVNWSASFTSGTMTVNASNSCGGGGLRSQVIAGAPATPPSISGNSAPCANDVESYSTAGSTGATSYIWTVPSGASVIGPANGASILVQWGITGGSITVRASNSCGNSGTRSLACTISCRLSQVQQSAIRPKVYPNPAFEKATLKFTSPTADSYRIELNDAIGRTVSAIVGSAVEGINLVEMDLSAQAKGVYFIRLYANYTSEQVILEIE